MNKFNKWYFAELLAVVKENNHPEFNGYYEIAIENGMSEAVFERKLKELSELKIFTKNLNPSIFIP